MRRNISKKKEEYLLADNNLRKNRLDYKNKLTNLNDKIIDKIKSFRKKGVSIFQHMVSEIAEKIYTSNGINDFKYSRNWFKRIKQKKRIRN